MTCFHSSLNMDALDKPFDSWHKAILSGSTFAICSSPERICSMQRIEDKQVLNHGEVFFLRATSRLFRYQNLPEFVAKLSRLLGTSLLANNGLHNCRASLQRIQKNPIRGCL